MMNLEDLNLVGLNAQEVQEIEGGTECPCGCQVFVAIGDYAVGFWNGFWSGVHGN